MKKVKLKVLIALILTVTVIYNCKEPDSIEVSQEKESVITNYELKKTTSNSKGMVNYSVINVTKEDIYSAKSFNNKINELTNLSLNKNTYSSILYYNENELIGYEFFFEEEAYLKHSFYLKKDEMFEEVFELLDNKIDPTNVEFVISFYLSEYNDLDAKLLINKSFNYNNYEEQKSEFGLFKNAIIYNPKLNIEDNSGKASSKELPMIGCNAICDAMGWGSCDFDILECTGCNKSSRASKLLSDESFTVEIINQMLIDNDDLHYDFRDFLENSTKYKIN
ncbi:MAG: hypothetical protein PSN34_00515 [Urechidicola sp.]|nr:hypothetical protein [Urechidicola sp.]